MTSKARFLMFILFGCFLHAQGQIINTVAGNGTGGYMGDGLAATTAELNQPNGITFDAGGNMYIADRLNNVVRKINAAGTITTVAGNNTAGFSGDGGAATAAELNTPVSVAFDGSGNLYIADEANSRIRKVDLTGTITTFAGTGVAGYSSDGVAATTSKINVPWGICTDNAGNLYISDEANQRIRKVNTLGIISTIAGTGTAGYNSDGIAATGAQINNPSGIVADAAGDVYFCEYNGNRIRKIDASGIISTVAGNGTTGYSGDTGPATSCQVSGVIGLDIDPAGNLYFVDRTNQRVRKITAITGVVNTIAGSGIPAFTGDGMTATAASVNNPNWVKLDCGNNVYISETSSQRIREIYVNHPPMFTGGDIQSLTVCEDSLTFISSLLGVDDLEMGEWETWAVAAAPANGTLVSTYATQYEGAVVYPVALSYTPATGFIGSDVFKVKVTDCGGLSDTTTVIVTVANCALGVPASAVTGSEHISVYPNPGSGIFTVSLSSPVKEQCRYAVTNLLGQQVLTLTAATNQPTTLTLNVPEGVYFIAAQTAQGVWSERVVVK